MATRVQWNRLQDVIPAMTEAYQNGASLKQLSTIYGGSPNTVRKALANAGVSIRRRGRKNREV
jgi:lambda repressor-like predicted transcriptional regulator